MDNTTHLRTTDTRMAVCGATPESEGSGLMTFTARKLDWVTCKTCKAVHESRKSAALTIANSL